uniref:Uncharacterized protein n=1 Tax=Arundo donax TaxID=35708 RepID=A0A0A9C3F7_ARUDO
MPVAFMFPFPVLISYYQYYFSVWPLLVEIFQTLLILLNKKEQGLSSGGLRTRLQGANPGSNSRDAISR